MLAAAVLAVAGVCAVAAGCGGQVSGTVRTDDPAATFAPLVLLHPAERLMPMGAGWFLERSALWFAEDQGCGDRKIAVGRRLAGQRDEIVDWLHIPGLGDDQAYERDAYDADCELNFDAEFQTTELTRPGQRRGRPTDLRLGEGYYLDLMDWARRGPVRGADAERALARVPVYVERRRDDVDGQPGLRLTYWMLFGADAPAAERRHGGGSVREGDWERVEVALKVRDGGYEPVAVRLPTPAGVGRELAWDTVARASDGAGAVAATHPVVTAAYGTHALSAGRRCGGCVRWATWRRLERAAGQGWFGYGGAWGDAGPTARTTGPLGPGAPDPGRSADERGLPAAYQAARPQVAFAPLVRFHRRESSFPLSARRFIRHSSLKWKDSPCGILDNVATGTVADAKTPGRVPRLRARLLARPGAYARRMLDRSCERPVGRAYSTADHTRLYEPRQGPDPLPRDRGFYLDLLSDTYDGTPRFTRRGGRLELADVPAYHETRRATFDGRPGLTISYWMLYPRTETLLADGRIASHEGGWERIDIRLSQGRRDGHWAPVAVVVDRPHDRLRIPWTRLDRAAGPDGGPATHPVLYAARASHVPYPHPGRHRRPHRYYGPVTAIDRAASCPTCPTWPTWRLLQPLRSQPWYRYGGGWGFAYKRHPTTGPAGPSTNSP